MSKENGKRYNDGKPKLSFTLLGLQTITGEADTWQKGEVKYDRGNWTKGMPYTEAADSLLRHLAAFLNGEDNDPESGDPHVNHIICCAKILSNSYYTRPDLDDRGTIGSNDDNT